MDIKRLKDTPPWEWPPNAGALFLDVLHDMGADPSDRLIAAGLAGDFTVLNDKLAEALMAVMRNADEPADLRAGAAVSLGLVLEYVHSLGLGSDDNTISSTMSDRIKQSFRDLYEDENVPGKVRRRILEVAVRAPQDWHPGAVRAFYRNDDEDYKLTAVFCMGHIPGFDSELMEAMESDNPAIRHEAARAAGNWCVDMDWLDIDSPLTSEEDHNSLFPSAIHTAVGSSFLRTERPPNIPRFSDKDEILDVIENILSMDDLPWDDEFIETDEDDD